MLLTIVIFLAILSVLVIGHEIGHFITAKYFGVQIQEFGLGFPPKAKTIAKTKDGVNWTLNWLPLGGFVKLKGEDGESREDPDSFGQKRPWKRIVILSAGVAMNLFFAFFLLSVGYAVGWPQDLTGNTDIAQKNIKKQNIIIMYVEKDTPADKAGIKAGDLVLSVNNTAVTEITDLQNFIKNNKDTEIIFKMERIKEPFIVKVAPTEVVFNLKQEDDKTDIIEKMGIGVVLGKIGVMRYPVHTAIWLGAKNTVIYTGKIFNAFGKLIKNLVVRRKISSDVGGPVMIAAISGKVARLGFIYIIQFVALLSLNLAIINILPIPALDGGRILFVIVEKFKGRAVSVNLESWTHLIGFWLLILLTVLITARDIARFEVWEKVKNIIAS